LAATVAIVNLPLAARSATPSALLDGYRQAAGAAPSAARGQQFFTQGHGREWSCSSCHGAAPTVTGRHASTGKPIAPLAPAVNAERFTDAAKSEKWFRRNCNDVVGRECTAAEKADVLAWLSTLKP
jgi:mono/diheme cytochrome c family protein